MGSGEVGDGWSTAGESESPKASPNELMGVSDLDREGKVGGGLALVSDVPCSEADGESLIATV